MALSLQSMRYLRPTQYRRDLTPGLMDPFDDTPDALKPPAPEEDDAGPDDNYGASQTPDAAPDDQLSPLDQPETTPQRKLSLVPKSAVQPPPPIPKDPEEIAAAESAAQAVPAKEPDPAVAATAATPAIAPNGKLPFPMTGKDETTDPGPVKSNLAQRIALAALSLTRFGPMAEQLVHPKWSEQERNHQQWEAEQASQAKIQQEQAKAEQERANAEKAVAQAENYSKFGDKKFHVTPNGIIVNLETGEQTQAPKPFFDKYQEAIRQGFSPEDAKVIASGSKFGQEKPVKDTTQVISPEMADKLKDLGIKAGAVVPSAVYASLTKHIEKLNEPGVQTHYIQREIEGQPHTIRQLLDKNGAKLSEADEGVTGHSPASESTGTWEIVEDAQGKPVEHNSRTGEVRLVQGGAQRPGTQAKVTAADEKKFGGARDALVYAQDYLNRPPTGPDDEALLEKYFELAKPSTGFRMNQVQLDMLQKSRSLYATMRAQVGHGYKGTWFDDTQRRQIVNTMAALAKAKGLNPDGTVVQPGAAALTPATGTIDLNQFDHRK